MDPGSELGVTQRQGMTSQERVVYTIGVLVRAMVWKETQDKTLVVFKELKKLI